MTGDTRPAGRQELLRILVVVGLIFSAAGLVGGIVLLVIAVALDVPRLFLVRPSALVVLGVLACSGGAVIFRRARRG